LEGQSILRVVARDPDKASRLFGSRADRSSLIISILNRIKSGLQRNLIERELYLRASGLHYTVVRAPVLTNAPAGEANVRITRAIIVADSYYEAVVKLKNDQAVEEAVPDSNTVTPRSDSPAKAG
jgi:hypothetical protein